MAKRKNTNPPPAKPKKMEVKITPAKGRPMLQWVGKRPLSHLSAFPAQHVESFHPAPDLAKDILQPKMWKDWPPGYPKGGLLFHGDNKDILAHLLANGFRGRVQLVYIDPPFDSGADYVRKVNLRGGKASAKMAGAGYGMGEQIQYTDIWANDNYLQFIFERLLLQKEMLSETGSLALHCDAKRSHSLRCLLEEVFGPDNFRGEIIVRAGVKNVQSQFEEMSSLTLGSNTIFLYSKSTATKYPILKTMSEDFEAGKWDTFWRGTDRPTMRYELFSQCPEHGQWRWEKKRAAGAIANYEKYLATYAKNMALDDYYLAELEKGVDLDLVRLSDDKVVQYYVAPRKYKLLSNVWLDLPYRGTETDYPTEKNEAIAERLATWLSEPGDLLMDCFLGSGTVAAVAQRLGRRWIGGDINKGAIQVAAKRQHALIRQQVERLQNAKAKIAQGGIYERVDEPGHDIRPAQLSFAVYRVNDYDLAIQHNEAVNLACDHIGVERTRTDSYFDGTYRKGLAKIISFGHPLTPEDLEELRRELDARPDEDRAITLVCLGMETAAKAWIEDWNRLRTGKNKVNRIDVIELRTDERYGKFIQHIPASARVKFSRRRDKLNGGDKITVEIEDFLSPTIVDRLQGQAALLAPKIDDWRAMVDCVMIDPAYDGEVFNVSLSDVPERKSDLVQGSYTLRVPEGETTVAVKIIDMLGEEVLVTREV